ncbi:unnamed protein product, partial [marine sediment metagenome]
LGIVILATIFLAIPNIGFAKESVKGEKIPKDKRGAPTIELQIYSGPTYSSADGVCYYRVKAIVNGKPGPTVEFSKDDNHGAWGSKKAQVNLNDPDETYTLTATATNSKGKATDFITLSWGSKEGAEPENTITGEEALEKESVILKDSFNGSLENWNIIWGDIRIENGEVSLSTPPTTSINETSSALLASRKRASDFSFEVTLRTLEQLRQGNNPNNWEVGWIFFRYTDPANFYWVLLKTNGYELGKKQGSYDQSYDTYGNQIFLVNTDEPDFPINQNYRIKVLA